MEATERRMEILKLLCKCRYEKISDLATEFGVCERTIRRDIQVLSLLYPVYTKSGKYEGGVYMESDLSNDGLYLQDSQKIILEKLVQSEKNNENCLLAPEEAKYLIKIISNYAIPE